MHGALVGGSPVSDDGRGLKRIIAEAGNERVNGSPVSDDGRGLKHRHVAITQADTEVRPSAMTGVD